MEDNIKTKKLICYIVSILFAIFFVCLPFFPILKFKIDNKKETDKQLENEMVSYNHVRDVNVSIVDCWNYHLKTNDNPNYYFNEQYLGQLEGEKDGINKYNKLVVLDGFVAALNHSSEAQIPIYLILSTLVLACAFVLSLINLLLIAFGWRNKKAGIGVVSIIRNVFLILLVFLSSKLSNNLKIFSSANWQLNIFIIFVLVVGIINSVQEFLIRKINKTIYPLPVEKYKKSYITFGLIQLILGLWCIFLIVPKILSQLNFNLYAWNEAISMFYYNNITQIICCLAIIIIFICAIINLCKKQNISKILIKISTLVSTLVLSIVAFEVIASVGSGIESSVFDFLVDNKFISVCLCCLLVCLNIAGIVLRFTKDKNKENQVSFYSILYSFVWILILFMNFVVYKNSKICYALFTIEEGLPMFFGWILLVFGTFQLCNSKKKI